MTLELTVGNEVLFNYNYEGQERDLCGRIETIDGSNIRVCVTCCAQIGETMQMNEINMNLNRLMGSSIDIRRENVRRIMP